MTTLTPPMTPLNWFLAAIAVVAAVLNLLAAFWSWRSHRCYDRAYQIYNRITDKE